MRRVILLVCLLGCGGGDGSGSATTGGDGGAAAGTGGGSAQAGATGTGGATGGSGPGTGGATATGGAGAAGAVGSGGTGTGGSATGGAPATGGSGGGGGTGGATPPQDAGGDPLYCPQVEGLSSMAGGCGFLGGDGKWVSMWKGDRPCTHCVAMGKQYTSCLIASPEGVGGEGPGPDLCVMNCRQECCYKRPNAACENDGQCCAPMHCQDNGPGMNQTCR